MGEHATVKWFTRSALRKLHYEAASEPETLSKTRSISLMLQLSL